jgi:hypothetical protein
MKKNGIHAALFVSLSNTPAGSLIQVAKKSLPPTKKGERKRSKGEHGLNPLLSFFALLDCEYV